MMGLSQALSALLYYEDVEFPGTEAYEPARAATEGLNQLAPYCAILLVLEATLRWVRGWGRPRDYIGSLSAGLLAALGRLAVGTSELLVYAWLYERVRAVELAWDSSVTFWLAFLGVDFCFYCSHRFSHEVNFVWAAHQVHHSSDEFNLSTSVRQSALQRFVTWFFYLPLALVIPPPAYLVHKQFNLLYQFWIHTEVVGHLGPLELLLNTPSHHRVHHGRNHYCIDVNYGGVLIVWDRMLGTFQAERAAEQPVYGLSGHKPSHNPLWVQTSHYFGIVKKVGTVTGLGNKLSAVLKGPSWQPGLPRCGIRIRSPHPPPSRHREDRPPPAWLSWYCGTHIFIMLLAVGELTHHAQALPYMVVFLLILYFTVSLTNFGLMFECNRFCAAVEVARLLVLLLADSLLTHPHHEALSPSLLTHPHHEALSLPPQAGLSVLALRVSTVPSLALWSAILTKQQLQG